MREKLQLWGITVFFMAVLVYTVATMIMHPI